MVDLDGRAWVMDTQTQRFYYLTPAQWISYTILHGGDTFATGCYSVPSTWTLEQMIDMIDALKAAIVETYPQVKFLTNYPGTKSRLLAQAVVSVASEHDSYQIFRNREQVADPEAFLEEFLDCDEPLPGNPWLCAGAGTLPDRIAGALALTTTPLPPMVRYYAIDDGRLVSESTERPTGPYHTSISLSERFAACDITVGPDGTLHYEPKE
jgi:hypothetical protein